MPGKIAIDLFCRVIDNYGDIGVCWRLARQLVAEHGCEVRLIVDDLASFRVIAPEIRTDAPAQRWLGVDILQWAKAESLQPAAVVIEAFACDPPEAYVSAMAAQAKAGLPPVWINLEYLSAEAWVDDVHGRASPHPRLPLTKHFFCPGFTPATGGLIREQGVGTARRPESQSRTLEALPSDQPLLLFAFAYPHAPLRALAQGFNAAGIEIEVRLAGPLLDNEADWRALEPVPQPDFDALLAQFDFLIVRGEDSFIRAQWSAKPMLWHIYPTDDGAHLVKLDAWLDRYCEGLETSVAGAYRTASHAFNRGETGAGPYANLVRFLPQLAVHASHWRESLMLQTDLATRLVRFVDLVKSQKLG